MDIVTADLITAEAIVYELPMKMSIPVDPVDHPPHYNQHKWEVIEIIEEFFENNYFLGNVFKYLSRAEYKGKELEDLKKARWYLDRYIGRKEKELLNGSK